MKICHNGAYHQLIPIVWEKSEKAERAILFMCQWCLKMCDLDALSHLHTKTQENHRIKNQIDTLLAELSRDE